jgi:hypothetical protein
MDELEDDAAAEHDPKALEQKLTSRTSKPAS